MHTFSPGTADVNPRNAKFAALLFALLFLLLLGASIAVYRSLVKNEERQFEDTLNQIADIRTAAVSAWTMERLGDAMVFGSGRFLGETMNAWMARGAPDDNTRRQVREQLEAIKKTYSYIDVAILDTAGNKRISIEDDAAPVDAVSRDVVQRAIAARGTQISPIRPTANAADRVIDIVTPLLAVDGKSAAISSVLFLRANANLPLEPYVHSLPLLATSSQILLAEIRGGQVVVAAIGDDSAGFRYNERLPITPDQLLAAAYAPSAHFVLTTAQGNTSISVARKIFGSPWFLLALIDQKEIRANLQRLAWIVGSIGAGLLGMLGIMALAWWRKKESEMQLQALQATTEKQLLQRQYDYLSKYANDMIILADANSKVLEVNDKSCQLLGYERGDLLGMPLESLFHPSCRALLQTMLRRLRDEGTAVFELLQRHAGGSTFPVEASARAIKLDGTSVIQFICRDISERKASEAALRESQDKLNGILASIHDVVWSFAPGLERLIYMNRSVEQIYGYPPSAFEQNPRLWREVIHPEDQPRVARTLQGLTYDHPGYEEEYRIVRRDGEVRWVHCRGQLVVDERRHALRIDGVTTDITQKKLAQQQVQTLAYYDSVTTLPNRALLNDRLAQAMHMASRSRKQVAVLFMDLDNFKHINDSLGHQVGDLLLRSIGERLLQCVREEDTVARIGGDEFVVVLPDIERGEQAVAVAEKILAATAQPYMLQEHQIHATISIGISVFPADGKEPHELIKHADAALYQAKGQGRNNYQFFTPELNHQITRSSNIERQLRHAIDAGELSLWYQPQIDLNSGRLVGAEALMRWRHAGRDFLAPDEFIPVAEERGLINQIGEWALREACLQCHRWQKEGVRSIPISVNVSPMQFQQKNFAGLVIGILDEIRLHPSCLELEITESSIMRRAPQVAALARRLRDAGVKISIDDFGTGYSSLSYLKQIPIDKIKIDRSFIADMLEDPDDEAITYAIINLAHSLNLRVVAEGVESKAQLDRLRLFGCNEGQGHYYSTAVSADTLHGLLVSDKIFAEPVS